MVTPQQTKLLDAIVREVPDRWNDLFLPYARQLGERGACTTFSRMLMDVLMEFAIWAEVRSVYVETVNKVSIEFLEGRITEEEAIRRGAKIQMWGDVSQGRLYQHAVCRIPEWNVVIDLAMERRGSMLVPSHPYWAEVGKFPWWVYKFEFRDYPLEYRVYNEYPELVKQAKDILRDVVRRYQ